MSDTPRTIGGLTPRSGQPDLTRLQRRNRTDPTPLDEYHDGATISPMPTAPTPSTPTTAPRQAATPSSATQSADRITVYLNHDLRARARSAYRATAHLEGDRTWSDFIERAIRAEVERREAAHNSGQHYSGTTEPLAPGRPVS